MLGKLFKLTFPLFLLSVIGLASVNFIPLQVGAQGGTVTVSSRVSSSTDDAEEVIGSGAIDLTSSDLELGAEGGGSKLQSVGMRFNNVSVPQGATVVSAYIEFEVDEIDSISTNLTIWGEASDNASIFSSQTFNVTSRTKTSSTVPWNNLESWSVVSEKKYTPDLSNIIQEIVTRPAWSQDNSMVVMIEGSGERTAEAYDGENLNAPLLVISYSVSGDITP